MSKETKVLYNAECPVCRFEIHHYRDYTLEEGLPIKFDDLNGPDRDAWGIDEDTAARRLFVQKDGVLLSGVPAFIALWQDMPKYKRLAQFAGLPVIKQIASAIYDYALAPAIYASHIRRRRRTGRPVPRSTT